MAAIDVAHHAHENDEGYRRGAMASGWDKNQSDYGGPVNPWPEIVALVLLFGGLIGAIVYRLLL
jgi:hypothetical protein